jgi:GTP-binding protein Era
MTTSDPTPPIGPDTLRSGMIAVVGRANVGKSTLVNAALGEKVSIVSPVAQTTRNLIRGVLTEARGQLVFLDTPGVHKAESDLGRIMNRTARSATDGADIILLVLDGSTRPVAEDEGWMRRLYKAPEAIVAILNKTDQNTSFHQDYESLWADIGKEKDLEKPIEWMSSAAKNGVGIDTLVNRLFEAVPPGPLLFPEEMLSDFPRKLAIADIIREQYFQVLQQELPHSMAVWIEKIDEAEDGWNISSVIYVNRSSQKAIVLGKKGRLIKRVRHQAEKEVSEIYEIPIRIHLWVKVEKDWGKNFWIMRNLGYA